MIELLFTDHDNWFSNLIKWVTQSNVSHAAMVYFDDFIYQASGLKVNLQTKKFFEPNHKTIAKFKLKNVSDDAIYKASQDILLQFDKGYDMLGIVGIAYCIFMERIFKKDVKNPFNSRSSYWCSELMGYFIERLSFHEKELNNKEINFKIDPDKVTPEDLVELFRNTPNYFQEI